MIKFPIEDTQHYVEKNVNIHFQVAKVRYFLQSITKYETEEYFFSVQSTFKVTLIKKRSKKMSTEHRRKYKFAYVCMSVTKGEEVSNLIIEEQSLG